tara:strand:+ start:3308 stop:3739 length:432 start_codon:yes stop_codon:yes gene_type:complete
MVLQPSVWGPHYWFTLHTIALCYPLYPNDVTKKKYYDFIQNFPLFIPIEDIGNTFSRLLDKYPVTPYLDSRESFMKWVHFIHNKINVALDMPEMTMEEALSKYYDHYKPVVVKSTQEYNRREKIAFIAGAGLILIAIYFGLDK